MTLAAGDRVGKYVVRRKVAEGGMAEIYLCSSVGPAGFEKEVALKRIRPFLASDPDFVKMFISEARIASRLNHGNIVQVFDFDRHEDTYYLAMEFVRGRSLAEVRRCCKQKGVPMPPTLVAHLGSEVAAGLAYVHGKSEGGRSLGLVHRDVTPHNVLLSYEGEVKLADFGIVRKEGDRLTAPGALKGKMAYMAPEQARGEEVDARTDIFALGIVLWEMLTGGRLFEADSDVGLLKAVQESAIAPPRRLNPDVPEQLDKVVMSALERDLERRLQTAQEFERALRQFLLSHQRSIEESDLASFMRGLMPEEYAQAEAGKGTGSAGTAKSAASLRPADRVSLGAAPSPDEDGGGPTWLFNRERREVLPPGPSPTDEIGRTEGGTARLPPPLNFRRWARAAAVGVLAAGVVSAVWGAQVLREETSVPVEAPPAQERVHPAATSVVVAPSPPTTAPDNEARGAVEDSLPVVPGAVPATSSASTSSRSRRGSGTIVLQASPWAEVFLDGKPLGEISGLKTFRVAPGRHGVKFVHPRLSRENFVSVESGARVVVPDFRPISKD